MVPTSLIPDALLPQLEAPVAEPRSIIPPLRCQANPCCTPLASWLVPTTMLPAGLIERLMLMPPPRLPSWWIVHSDPLAVHSAACCGPVLMRNVPATAL